MSSLMLRDSIFSLIENSSYREAGKKISALERSCKRIDKRIAGHLRSRIESHQGNYKTAIKIIENTIKLHGENIAILAERVVNLMKLRDFYQWKKHLHELNEVFDDVGHMLDQEKYVETSILLGKFFEQAGELTDSHIIYKSIMGAKDPKVELSVLTQMVRFQAMWGIDKDFERNFSRVHEIYSQIGEWDIEVEHAIMHGEMKANGAEKSWERVSQMIKDNKLDQDWHKEMILDFVEAAIRMGHQVPSEAMDELGKWKELNIFEKTFKKVAQTDSELNLERILILQGEISMNRFLRILGMIVSKENTEDIAEAKRIFKYIVSNFDPGSKEIWKNLYSELVFVKK